MAVSAPVLGSGALGDGTIVCFGKKGDGVRDGGGVTVGASVGVNDGDGTSVAVTDNVSVAVGVKTRVGVSVGDGMWVGGTKVAVHVEVGETGSSDRVGWQTERTRISAAHAKMNANVHKILT